MQKAFFGEPGGIAHPATHDAVTDPTYPLPPISLPERIGALLLIGVSLTIGLYPQLILTRIISALSSPLFDGMRKGGWQ
jgi:NADH-quinone oxidoreductase subunit M